jgi:tetrahydromethanopterin S-methyltransferase subunit G
MQPPFIIEDLDETHLFIDTDHIDEVMERLDEILEENTYKGAEEKT